MTEPSSLQGGCTCGKVRYELASGPMFVHCCHCSWCQRETGSAFALNALIESDRVSLISGKPERVDTPSDSGKGQAVWRCPDCRVALWSNYSGSGERVHFVRVGTLDPGHGLEPDIHIYTSTKQPWVILPEGARVKREYYNSKEEWPEDSQARWLANRA
jgi:hypothetical protein